MSDSKYFPSGYDDARSRFLRLTRELSLDIDSFHVPSLRDESLFVDFAEGHASEKRETLLVLTSGVHGTEAFAGVAIQQMFLREILPLLARDRVGIFLAHCLNPFGFKYNRRSTEANVNLNRNFGASEELFRTPNENYERVAHLIKPRAKAHGPARSLVETLSFVARCLTLEGFTGDQLTRALAQGQFKHSEGMEFGGFTWEPQIRRFIEKLKSAMALYRNIVIFDLHTGLGHRYELHLIPVDDPKSRDEELMRQLFDPASERHLYQLTQPSEEGFYETFGDLNSLPPKIAKADQRTLTLTFEFGTLGNSALHKIQSLSRVLTEIRGYHLGYSTERARRKNEELYLELFAPKETRWRENVIERSRELLSRVASRL